MVNVGLVGAALMGTKNSTPVGSTLFSYHTVGQSLPTGRVGEAADIAKAHLYLMTEGFSTAAVLTVDGGASVV
jgi:hypothetical protein